MTGVLARAHRVRVTGESGSALAIALVFLMLFGVLIGVVLEFAATGQRSAVVLRSEATNTYAGGGAVDGAINAVRANLSAGTASAGTTTCFTLSAAELDNPSPIAVTCRPRAGSGAMLSGSTASQPAHAVLALSGTATEGLTLAGSANVPVQGAVAVASQLRSPAGSTLTSTAGITAGTCTGTGTVTPACTSPATASDPGWTGPDAGSRPLMTTLPTCSPLITLTPGIYRSAPALQALINCANSVIWFRPGTYYFDFRDAGSHELVTGAGDVLVGGAPAGWTPAATAASANPASTIPSPTAASPTTSACDPNAAGVDLVFGGDSRLNVGAGNVQLCALETGTANQHIVLRGLAGAGTVAATGTSATAGSSDLNVSSRKWTTPANGAAVDGQTAYVKVPNVASIPPRLLVGPISATTLPVDATGITVTVNVTESLAGTGDTLLDVRPGDASGTTGTQPLRTCPGAGCAAGMQIDTVQLTGLTPAQVNGMSFELVVSNPNNSPIDVWVDGITVDVTYTLPVRPSCQLASPTGACVAGSVPPAPLLTSSGSASATTMALHGTVYAPRAAVNLGVTSVPYVVVDRGLAVRHLQLAMTPAAAYTGPLITIPAIGQAPRRVLLTATDGTGAVLITADVTFADAAGSGNGKTVRVNEWAVR